MVNRIRAMLTRYEYFLATVIQAQLPCFFGTYTRAQKIRLSSTSV